jgi:anaerobic selenocysteine-containing dehydrogenase
LAEHDILPVVVLSAEEAASLCLTNGETVRVESPAGCVSARLETKAGQRRDILVSERGGWLKAGHGLNRLTRDVASRVGNGTPYYETAVRIVKL